jgi:copper transport protein
MKRLFVLVGFVAAVVAWTASPAWAHASLQGTEPASGTEFAISKPPKAVSITFNEPVTLPANAIQVLDHDGKAVNIGKPGFGADGRHVTATLPPLPKGTYVVSWRVVSDDSHPVQGAFTFGVGEAAGAVTAGAVTQTSRPVGVGFGIVRFVAYLSSLLLLGGIALARWSWRGAARRRDVRVLLWTALVVVSLTALAGIAFQGAYANGRGFGDILNGSAISDVLSTRFGAAWRDRALLAIALVPIMLTLAREIPRWARVALDVLFVAASVGIAATFAYAGHGATGRLTYVALPADMIHILAAAAWFGGLAVLALALHDPEQPEGAARATDRFSSVALPAITIVIISGTVQAWRQIETWPALWQTSYARLLIVKVLLVGGIVVVASASRDILRRHVAPAIRNVVGVGAAWAEAPSDDVRRLRDAVWVEVLLAIVVIGVTAGLVNTEPAREALAATPRTFSATVPADKVVFKVGVQPTVPGQNVIVIAVQTPDGKPAKVTGVTATLGLPGRVAPIPLTLAPTKDNKRFVASAAIPFAGTWTLVMRATRSQFDESAATTKIRFG